VEEAVARHFPLEACRKAVVKEAEASPFRTIVENFICLNHLVLTCGPKLDTF